MHEAQYLEPVMRNIETFLDDTQQFVTVKWMWSFAPTTSLFWPALPNMT